MKVSRNRKNKEEVRSRIDTKYRVYYKDKGYRVYEINFEYYDIFFQKRSAFIRWQGLPYHLSRWESSKYFPSDKLRFQLNFLLRKNVWPKLQICYSYEKIYSSPFFIAAS